MKAHEVQASSFGETAATDGSGGVETAVEVGSSLEMRRDAAWYETLLDALPVLTAYVDSNLVYRYCNRHFEEWFGVSRDEIVDHRLVDVLGQEAFEIVRSHAEAALAGRLETFEVEVPYGDGGVRHVSAIYVPHLVRGEVLGFFALDADTTEKFERHKDRLRIERNNALGELMLGVTHNLNNLLTGIMVPAQLLNQRVEDPDLKSMTEVLLASGRLATELVANLNSAVVRPDEGNVLQKALERVDLNQVVRRAVEVTRPRWWDQPHAMGLEVAVEVLLDGVPPVMANEAGLADVIINLLVNAVEALPQGGIITIRTWREEKYVVLSVHDDGVGMREEVRSRAFEPFFTTKSAVGSGLGLFSVRSSIKAYGGSVEVESSPGKGVTFVIRLESALAPLEHGDASRISKRGAGVDSRMRLLLVDDHEPVTAALSQLLELYSYDVDSFATPQEALEGFVPEIYQIAILDFGIPQLGGDQLVQLVRRVDPNVVMILLSDWKIKHGDARLNGFDFHIQKPILPDQDLYRVLDMAGKLYNERISEQR